MLNTSVARKTMVRAVITVSAALPPPGRNATGAASSAMIAMFRTVLSLELTTIRSRVFYHDSLEDVGGRLCRVDGALQDREDVLPADHHHRVDAVREQGRD